MLTKSGEGSVLGSNRENRFRRLGIFVGSDESEFAFVKVVSYESSVRSSSEDSSFVRLNGRSEKFVQFDGDVSNVIIPSPFVPIENREVDVPMDRTGKLRLSSEDRNERELTSEFQRDEHERRVVLPRRG